MVFRFLGSGCRSWLQGDGCGSSSCRGPLPGQPVVPTAICFRPQCAPHVPSPHHGHRALLPVRSPAQRRARAYRAAVAAPVARRRPRPARRRRLLGPRQLGHRHRGRVALWHGPVVDGPGLEPRRNPLASPEPAARPGRPQGPRARLPGSLLTRREPCAVADGRRRDRRVRCRRGPRHRARAEPAVRPAHPVGHRRHRVRHAARARTAGSRLPSRRGHRARAGDHDRSVLRRRDRAGRTGLVDGGWRLPAAARADARRPRRAARDRHPRRGP